MSNEHKYHDILKAEFISIISTKTGWGKNEVLSAFETASLNAAMKYIDALKSKQA